LLFLNTTNDTLNSPNIISYYKLVSGIVFGISVPIILKQFAGEIKSNVKIDTESANYRMQIIEDINKGDKVVEKITLIKL
jgi:hypothetical protein